MRPTEFEQSLPREFLELRGGSTRNEVGCFEHLRDRRSSGKPVSFQSQEDEAEAR
jgi:hypothetical protein